MQRSVIRRAAGVRLVALFAALVIALSVSAAGPALATSAPGPDSCTVTWTGNTTKTKSVSPADGVFYKSTVIYQIGWNTCNLQTPERIKIVSFRNVMTFTTSTSTAYHNDREAAVFSWWADWESYEIKYYDGQSYLHQGNGTWTRFRPLSLNIPYRRSVAVYDLWEGCDWWGAGRCKMVYQFINDRLDYQWSMG